MEFIMTLSTLWSDTLMPAFMQIYYFFQRSLRDLYTFNLGDSAPNWIETLLNNIFSRFLELLTWLGLNVDVPLWQFLIVNAGVILTIIIVQKFLDIIRG